MADLFTEELFQISLNLDSLEAPFQCLFGNFSLELSRAVSESSRNIMISIKKKNEKISLPRSEEGQPKTSEQPLESSSELGKEKAKEAENVLESQVCESQNDFKATRTSSGAEISVNESKGAAFEALLLSSVSATEESKANNENSKIEEPGTLEKTFQGESFVSDVKELKSVLQATSPSLEKVSSTQTVGTQCNEPLNEKSKKYAEIELMYKTLFCPAILPAREKWITIARQYHTSSTYYHVDPRYWVRSLVDDMYEALDVFGKSFAGEKVDMSKLKKFRQKIDY